MSWRGRVDRMADLLGMELRFVFDSREHMRQMERWGPLEVIPQSVGQMDALLA